MAKGVTHNSLKLLADRLRSVRSVVLTTHSGPDGDGLGAVVAMQRALESRGCSVLSLLPDPLPARYGFLDGGGRLRCLAQVPAEELERDWELGLVLDTHQWEMLPPVGDWLKARQIPTVFLDHHPCARASAPEIFGSADAAATGELLYQLLRHELGWPIPPEVAEPLYVAISFDTNSFKYIRSNPSCLRIAAELVEAGVDTNRVYRHLFASNPLSKARLLGWVLSTVQFDCGGRLAYVAIPLAKVGELGLGRDDLRDCVTHILEIQGVEADATLKEMAPGEIKISLRSKGSFPISGVAQRMGGGGHPLAAGCDFNGSMEDAWRHLRAALLELCQGLGAAAGPSQP
jgi:bifunctional oligoribonuclease and PAP phosphatase NrnA